MGMYQSIRASFMRSKTSESVKIGTEIGAIPEGFYPTVSLSGVGHPGEVRGRKRDEPKSIIGLMNDLLAGTCYNEAK